MLRSILIVSILGAAVAAVACDPYSPDLGNTPYRCAESEPKCPDGYDAVTVPQPVNCECRVHGSTGGDTTPDASTMECSDDNTEPNDAIQNARPTPIGTAAQTATFPNEAICSVLDVDTYKVTCSSPNQRITATLQFNSAAGALTLRIVDPTGNRLDQGPIMQGNALVVTAKMPTTGAYYVQVGSSAGTNTYGLSLSLQ